MLSWQALAAVALLLGAGLGLVAMDQATIAGGLIASAVSIAGLFVRLPQQKGASDRAKAESLNGAEPPAGEQ